MTFSIQLALKRLRPHVHQTPLVESSQLNRMLGARILFKAENLQKVGAFKARGACNCLIARIESGEIPIRVIANSSGNHAQAVAWAARQFSIPATIYMPKNVSSIKAQATRAYGAEVIFGDDRGEVDQMTEEASEDEGVFWIPPYNHHDVIAGQGTSVFEVLEQDQEFDVVFAPCGGGGLLSGCLMACREFSEHIQVIGVEPSEACDAYESVKTGKIQRLSETPDTIADGARTLSIGNKTYPHLQQLDDWFLAEEEDIFYWTQWLNHLLKIRVEPTAAMVMQGVVEWLRKQREGKRLLVVLSGGNMDAQTTAKIWERDRLCITPGKKYPLR